MSERTPELRQMTASLIAAALPAAMVVQNSVDPVKAVRIVTANTTTLITVAFANVMRENISHASLFRAAGALDVVVYALSPGVLDSTLESVHAAVLSSIEWVSAFESVASLETDYEYVAAGDVDIAAARTRIACQWSEDYPFAPESAVELSAINFTTRPGRVVGPQTIFAEVDDTTGEIQIDDVVLEVCDDAVVFDEDSDVVGALSPSGDVIELEEAAVETEGFPKHVPSQERTE